MKTKEFVLVRINHSSSFWRYDFNDIYLSICWTPFKDSLKVKVTISEYPFKGSTLVKNLFTYTSSVQGKGLPKNCSHLTFDTLTSLNKLFPNRKKDQLYVKFEEIL